MNLDSAGRVLSFGTPAMLMVSTTLMCATAEPTRVTFAFASETPLPAGIEPAMIAQSRSGGQVVSVHTEGDARVAALRAATSLVRAVSEALPIDEAADDRVRKLINEQRVGRTMKKINRRIG